MSLLLLIAIPLSFAVANPNSLLHTAIAAIADMRADAQVEAAESMTTEQGIEALTAGDRYVVDFAAGGFHSLAILNDGTLWAWGSNAQGATGQGIATGITTTPRQIGGSTDWTSVIAPKSDVSLAIKTDGTLWAWGSNHNGATGLGTDTGNTLTPTQVGTLDGWTPNIVSNENVSAIFAVKPDGTLWTWGSNTSGQTGQGLTEGNISVPTQIGVDSDWEIVQPGCSGHVLAIKTDGTLWAWGNNASGRTGLGTSSGNTLTPTQVGTSDNWKGLSAGQVTSIGVQSDGTLWAWGSNTQGATGQGIATGITTTPTQIGVDADWASASISSGGTAFLHVVATKVDGSLWAWGANVNGQTGLGTDTGNTLTPTQVGNSTDWIISPVLRQRFLQSDGSLWTWGRNANGRTGLGTDSGNTLTPTRVGTSTNWSSVSAGNLLHSLAIQSDGTLWSWGSNTSGQTGTGQTGNTLIPTPVGPVAVTTMAPTGTGLAPESITELTINLNFPIRTGIGDRVITLTNTTTGNTVELDNFSLNEAGTTLTIPVLGNLAGNSTYRIDISGWHSVFGAPLSATNRTFTTGERAPDPFTVTQVLPEGTNVAVDTENLVITFSEPVNTTTGTRSVTIAGAQLNHTFDVANAVVPVSEPGFWNVERTVLTLPMPEVLEFDTGYTVNTTGFVAVGGGALVPHTHVFTTESQQVIPEGDFTKTLTLPEGTTIPSPSFTFNFTAQQVVLDDTVTPNISSRPSADFATLLSNQTITLNAADAITENGTTTITGNLDIAAILSSLTFPGGGVYVWNVSEVANSSNTTTPSHMSYDDTLFQIRAWVNRYGDLEYIAIHNLERGEGSEIIDLGKTEDGINFFNTYMRQTGSQDNPAFEVSKEVTGDLANLDTLFNFTLSLAGHTLAPITNTPPATLPTTHFTARIVNAQGIVVDRTITITPGANNTYTLSFQLRHGETLQIPTLPAGTTFTATEAAHPEFSPSATITLGGIQLEADYEENVNTALTTGSHITRDTGSNSADFTNDHSSVPHTGLVVTSNVPLALIVGMGLLLTIMLALRNRQRIERMPL